MRTPFVIEFTGTPEAGKTTSITNVSNALLSMGYKVSVLRESAEKLPKEIPKGIWDANLWMNHQTQAGLIRAKYFKTDIMFLRYYDSLTCPKELIDTSEFSVYEMNQKVLGIIKEALS